MLEGEALNLFKLGSVLFFQLLLEGLLLLVVVFTFSILSSCLCTNTELYNIYQ